MGSDPRVLFGAAVRARRRQKAWSQAELAERAGLDRTYISGVERGVRNPSLLSQERIASALEVPLYDLVAPPKSGGG